MTSTTAPGPTVDADADQRPTPAVTLLQRVLMPRLDDPRNVRSLYVDESLARTLRVDSRATAHLLGGDQVSFATYFNAFPAAYWRRWTSVPSVVLRLRLSGSGRVDVYRSKADGDIVHVTASAVGGTDQEVEFQLDLTPFIDGGWYWFDLVADSELTIVEAGWYADHEPLREGRLSVGICTFNRPGDCTAAMATIAADPVVSAQLSAVVVADQGNRKVRDDAGYAEVAALLGDRLHLVEQGNLGGSGGFARAMYETLERTDATHLLFLDDDVQLEADSLHRALTFSRFTDQPVLVGGQMLALQDRSVLHTMGEVVDRHSFLYRPAAYAVTGHNFAEQSLRETRQLHRRVDVDYNAWWMCLIPREVPEKLGLPLPLFIKWDDAEYGLRAKAAGYPTVTLPGAAIWHLAWTDKDDVSDWQAYFFARNRLIVAALHSPHTDGGGIPRSSILADLKHLLKLEYSAVALHLKAYEDFLAGPSSVFSALPTALGDVRAEQSRFPDSRVVTARSEIPEPELDAVVAEAMAQPPVGKRAILSSAVRGLRHSLRPAGEARDRPQVQLPAQDAQWYVLARLDSVAVGTADGRGVTLRQRDPAAFRDLLRRSVRLNREIVKRFPELSDRYRAAYGDLTSRENWRAAFVASGGDVSGS
ncbi:galactofuranosylgalactofuranosylrhamnosyl-N-acetylglucosaminyl-diphospho-decaprenol beta-1,5/1,6-galactofuranosyltransferase [Blastococcus colisei]|uniref:Galactofuranosylgalactofuranosylrhamnosyl-N-acetylglucosaminyl-diphospho-decaprenol beta-1,5/1,6-galactofuranosyltransferase n=1 Tax=Blastococcus colisei TaxID=1564162 RepID=A0A543PBP4_9ACTN|nr:glycosyltransferase [Blastococcus colisei]TQN41523.1 galactofuranosylgalactofuranosylrhamnosyl-N-acetylglucosaminyl-diphospho-decaprenol beta-1,5/1,6-galactofuranosyltransferase [Blastococcus colisei]